MEEQCCSWLHSNYRNSVPRVKLKPQHIPLWSRAQEHKRSSKGKAGIYVYDPESQVSQATLSATMPVPGEYQQVLGRKGGRGRKRWDQAHGSWQTHS